MSQNNGYPFGVRQTYVHSISSLTTPTYGTGVPIPAINAVEYDIVTTNAILKGEDRVVASATNTESGTFKFSGGGIGLAAHAVIEGETAVDSGTPPNDLTYLRKKASTCIPYFGAVARAVGPSCGQAGDPADFVVAMHKCKTSKRSGGKLGEGAFAMSDFEGQILPSPYDNDTIVLLQHRATADALSSTWPGGEPFLTS